MATVFIIGERFNHLARVPAAQVVMSPAALAGYEPSFLSDDFPGRPARFGSLGADGTITVDGNIVLSPGFEEIGSGPPLNWSEILAGAGSDVTRTVTAGEFDTGAAGMELKAGNVGGASAFGHQDVYVRAGETIVVKARGKTGTAANRKARLQNLETLKYYNGTSWVTSPADAATFNSTGSFVNIYGAGGLAVTIENFAACRKDRVLLRVGFLNDVQNSDAWIDNVTVHPGSNVAWISRHNIPPGITVEWRESSDNFSGSNVLVATLSVVRPEFGKFLASTNLQYQRLRFVGTPIAETMWFGEAGFSQVFQPTAMIIPRPVGFDLSEPQLRQDLSNGDARVFALGEEERYGLTLPFKLPTEAAFQEWLEILKRTRFGKNLMIVIPDTARAEVVSGRLAEASARFSIDKGPTWRTPEDMEIVPSGAPTWLTTV